MMLFLYIGILFFGKWVIVMDFEVITEMYEVYGNLMTT